MIPDASAEFVHRMEAVLSVYEQPYDEKHPKVCLDESPKQLISESRKGFTDSQGVQHIDYEYQREGVADLYMVVEPLAGRRKVWVEDNHNRFTYARIVAQLAEELYADADKITIVEDNLSAHKLAALYEIFEPHRARAIIEKIEIVRTPTHGSWLNVAECELSVLTRQGLKTHVATRQELKQQVKAWYERRNDQQKKVDWQFTTKDARIKLKKLYPSFNT